MAAPSLRAVNTADLEEYPIGREERLDGHGFVKWFHHRWLHSKTHLKASYEVQGMARALFDLAQMQSPIGTLPDDDEELAMLLRVDLPRWRTLRALEFGPLRNWRRCLAAGEVRLMHPVVLAQVQDALERREAHALSKEEKATYQRLKRLREGLKALGCSEDVLAEEVLIRRMDDWLRATCVGNRKPVHYERALQHAVREKWVAPRAYGGAAETWRKG